MAEIRLGGDFSEVSDWDDTWEVGSNGNGGGVAPLRAAEYPGWARALLRSPGHLELVGGTAVARELDLMLIPGGCWNDTRGASLGFPVYEDGELVNLIRRFLDGRKPKYQGLRGRGHQFWPDRSSLPPLGEPILLVCGMRDVCTARKYGVAAFTTTGGVDYWPAEWLEWLAAGRDFKVIFDVGEEAQALRLVRRLRLAGAASAWMRRLPRNLRGGEDLTDLDRVFGAESWLEQQMLYRARARGVTRG